MAFAIGAVCLLALWIFLFCPGLRKRDEGLFRDWLYAHRGLHGAGIPENSMAAFRKAIEAGFGIELDVHVTSDGVAVVHHDGNLKRICGVDQNIRDLTLKELEQIPLPDGSTIPTFAQVLELVAGRVPLIVEIKHESGPIRAAEGAWNLLRNYQGNFSIESFHPLAVRYFRKNAPQVQRGQLSSRNRMKLENQSRFVCEVAGFILGHLWTNFLCRPDYIAYDELHDRVVERFLASRLFRAIPVAWTIRSPSQQLEATQKGYRCMIFEDYLPENKKDQPASQTL